MKKAYCFVIDLNKKSWFIAVMDKIDFQSWLSRFHLLYAPSQSIVLKKNKTKTKTHHTDILEYLNITK